MIVRRSEIYSSLWSSCAEVRSGMAITDYKDYVLSFLFLKYMSDKGMLPNGMTYTSIVSYAERGGGGQ